MLMLRLVLPECQTCDKRFAAGFDVKLCHICRAEVDMLKELLEREDAE